jgi:hypothetical protein
LYPDLDVKADPVPLPVIESRTPGSSAPGKGSGLAPGKDDEAASAG